MSLNKTFILFGLATLAMIAVAVFATMPSSGLVQARERVTHNACRTEQVALDQGYGVTRTVERQVCDDY